MSESHSLTTPTEDTLRTRIPIKPGSFLDMRFPADADLSPDGKRVAFVVWERVADQPKQRGNIWVVATSEGEARPFTKGKQEESCPRWSPDGKRVAIGGWSNGGYLAAWAVTQTTRFKAAMMGAGISDWHNMHAQTNIADADILLLQADPLENPEVYRKHSPITYAGRVTTPTLILHGENDPAVPVAQAYAFYRALRERNIPVELVVYPREGHGLSERAHLIDGEERLLRWLEKYL